MTGREELKMIPVVCRSHRKDGIDINWEDDYERTQLRGNFQFGFGHVKFDILLNTCVCVCVFIDFQDLKLISNLELQSISLIYWAPGTAENLTYAVI